MNTPNKLTLNSAFCALLTLSLAVSAQAQSSLGASNVIQEEAQESPDRHGSPGADTTRRLIFWNEIALKANARDHARVAPLSPDQVGLLRTARAFAIVHIAMFDAFNAIVGGYESYTGLDPASWGEDFDSDRSRASVDAAIAKAAGDTLIALFPSQADDIEAIQRADLKTVPNGPAKNAGIRIGRRAAYAEAFKEVKRLGGDGVVTPTERTADQTIIGIFWAYDGTPFLGTNVRLYNQIAVKISEQMRTRGIKLARLLALVNVAMADAGLACFTTKYREEFWRPITAIRQGENDNNPDTIGDPNFVPLGAPVSDTSGPNFTPPFPSYTAGHATIGGALFQIPRRFYQTDKIAFSIVSDEFNGVTRDNKGIVRPRIRRRFKSLSDAEEENGLSRIYLGIHWSFDITEGIKQGNRVADYVFDNSFRRRFSEED